MGREQLANNKLKETRDLFIEGSCFFQSYNFNKKTRIRK